MCLHVLKDGWFIRIVAYVRFCEMRRFTIVRRQDNADSNIKMTPLFIELKECVRVKIDLRHRLQVQPPSCNTCP